MSQYEIKVRETITKIARVRAKSPDLAASALQEWLADNGDVNDLDYANVGPSTVLGDPVPSDAALWPAHVPDDEVYEDDGAPILPPRSERPEFWAQIGDHWWATNGHVAVREGEPACYGRQGYIIWSKKAPDAPTKLADWIARACRVLHFAETSPQYYDRMGVDDGAHVESAHSDGGEIVALNRRFWATWAQCDWSGAGALDPCVARRNGEPVAVVMPMRGDRTPRVMLATWARTGDPSEAQRLLARLGSCFPISVDANDLAWLVRKAIEVPRV